MKTKSLFSALGLSLFLASLTFASGAPVDGKKNVIQLIRGVRHHVTVYLDYEKKLCNTYLVEILDGTGQRVAPAKVFTPGIAGYDFYERGPVEGIRVAVLVPAPTLSQFVCERELFARPVMQKGIFEPGATYRYDLFPQSQPYKE